MSEQYKRIISDENKPKSTAVHAVGKPLSELAIQVFDRISRTDPKPKATKLIVYTDYPSSNRIDGYEELVYVLTSCGVKTTLSTGVVANESNNYPVQLTETGRIPEHIQVLHGVINQCMNSCEQIEKDINPKLADFATKHENNLSCIDVIDPDYINPMAPISDSFPTCADVLHTLCGNLPREEFEEIMHRLTREKPSEHIPGFGKFNSYLGALSFTSLGVWANLRESGIIVDAFNRDEDGTLSHESGKLINEQFYQFLYQVYQEQFHGGCPVGRFPAIDGIMQKVEELYHQEMADPQIRYIIDNK